MCDDYDLDGRIGIKSLMVCTRRVSKRFTVAFVFMDAVNTELNMDTIFAVYQKGHKIVSCN